MTGVIKLVYVLRVDSIMNTVLFGMGCCHWRFLHWQTFVFRNIRNISIQQYALCIYDSLKRISCTFQYKRKRIYQMVYSWRSDKFTHWGITILTCI